MQNYVNLVCAEVGATRALTDAPLTTVSFGGGVSLAALMATAATAAAIAAVLAGFWVLWANHRSLACLQWPCQPTRLKV
jgi:hypothetical protein